MNTLSNFVMSTNELWEASYNSDEIAEYPNTASDMVKNVLDFDDDVIYNLIMDKGYGPTLSRLVWKENELYNIDYWSD